MAPPREIEQFLQYFCGDAGDPNALNEIEALRFSFYKTVASFVRAYAAIAQNLYDAGYTPSEQTGIQREINFYTDLRGAALSTRFTLAPSRISTS